MDADTADENEDDDVTQWHSPKWKGDKEKYHKGIKSLFIVFHSVMKSFESVYVKRLFFSEEEWSGCEAGGKEVETMDVGC